MLKAVLRRYIRRFEVRWSYDASYFRDLLDLGSWTFIGFGLATSLGRRPEAPAAAMAAVGLVGTMTEDCGPCTPNPGRHELGGRIIASAAASDPPGR